MLEITQYSKLPRLLDLDDLPSATRRRQYWRYVHRWRRRLYYLWRQDVPKELNKAEIARGVDDLLAISLLLDYFRRMGRTNFSFIAEVHQQLSHPTVADIAAAFAETASDPFLSAVLGPQTFSNALPVPLRVVADDWQRRLGNATWLLYRDRRIPLSFFGEFHQFCTGNPLHTKSPDTEGRKKRRSRGMFYTPAPIVDYLVATTLAPLSNGQRPEDILKLRILDPSCGCGAFLIACNRYIATWLENHPDCDKETAIRLSLEVIERVLYGCDIDPGAVSWSIRLQLLTAWEKWRNHANTQSFGDTLSVPSLQNTILCKSFLNLSTSNSSPPPSVLSYDAIVGGPPFVRLEQLHCNQRDQIPLYRRRYLSARQGQYDLYMLFIEQALDLLEKGGRIAFSLSSSFLRSNSGRIIRGYIAANACVEEIVEFEDPKTYDDAATQIALLRLRKGTPRHKGQYAIIKGRGRLRGKLEQLASGKPDSDISIKPLQPEATISSNWKLATSNDSHWLNQVRQVGVPLGRFVRIEFGLSSGIDRVLLLKKIGQAADGIILAQSRENDNSTIRLEEAATRSVVRGHQLRGYHPPKLQHVYPFLYDANGQALMECDLYARFPRMYAYLLKNQAELSKRFLSKGFPWHSTFSRQPQHIPLGPRLLSAKITPGNSFSLY